MKGYERDVTTFLVAGMRDFPVAFARNMKTMFVHPELYQNSTVANSLQHVQALCRLHTQASQRNGQRSLVPILRQGCVDLNRQIAHTASFEDLLASTQALLLLQCLLILDENSADDGPYSESVSAMLATLGRRLWQQAPIQLPHTLSPRRAWLFGESRDYSVRTPFVDSLPFDIRTSLWDTDAGNWDAVAAESGCNMVSMYEYSSMLESGAVHGISPFNALILAACKGRAASSVPYPPTTAYRVYEPTVPASS
ncbi:hypothetical protein BDV25DRAFT_135731 [Aspergillus avenaceus]|uniref:Transcription factor domain-containing protein n=1 Tax=Aspergillus avenaceus TaxID=36643 RepID=A0A5N6U8W6_ASPAV|nr:hypothetical protein BDV25DRAFT_135731 [Aspergillus avenaceus]